MKPRQKFFPKEYEKTLNQYLIWWCLSVILVGSFIAVFNLQVNNYALFNFLGEITPAIGKWTIASDHEHVAKAVWVWMTYTAPIVVLRLVCLIKHVNTFKPILQFLFLLLFGYFVTSACAVGLIFGIDISSGTSTSEQYLLYKKYNFGTIFISILFGSAFILAYTSFILWVIEIFGLRKLKGESHG